MLGVAEGALGEDSAAGCDAGVALVDERLDGGEDPAFATADALGDVAAADGGGLLLEVPADALHQNRGPERRLVGVGGGGVSGVERPGDAAGVGVGADLEFGGAGSGEVAGPVLVRGYPVAAGLAAAEGVEPLEAEGDVDGVAFPAGAGGVGAAAGLVLDDVVEGEEGRSGGAERVECPPDPLDVGVAVGVEAVEGEERVEAVDDDEAGVVFVEDGG